MMGNDLLCFRSYKDYFYFLYLLFLRITKGFREIASNIITYKLQY